MRGLYRYLAFLTALAAASVSSADSLECLSPDGRLKVGFESDGEGMRWSLSRDGKTLVAPSRLGLSFALFKSAKRELGEMRVIEKKTRASDTTWTSAIYRRGEIRDCFNELEIVLEEVHEPRRRLGYVFRAYNEGAAFRYVIPEQDGVPGFEIIREHTRWRFPGKCRGWFTSYKSDFNSNEN